MLIIGGLILVILGIVMLFRPQLFYELTESWKHSGSSEPSGMWILSTRFGGVMFLLAGLAGLFLPLIA